MLIIHQFAILVSKKLFLNSDGYVVRTIENTSIIDAQKLGLTPILIYSLNVEGIPVRFMRFYNIELPGSVYEFLMEAWSEANLVGLPNILKVSNRFLNEFPWLKIMCETLNIVLVVANGNDRNYNVNQKVTQDNAIEKYWLASNIDDKEQNLLLEELNVAYHDNKTWSFPYEYSLKNDVKLKCNSFINIKPHYPPLVNFCKKEWDNFNVGEWLLNNQNQIPPRSKEQVEYEVQVTGGLIDYDISDQMIDGLDGNSVVNCILKCWPESLAAFAKRMDIKKQDLDWYLKSKKGLDFETIDFIHTDLQINVSQIFEYSDGSSVYEPDGNYFLLASEKQVDVDNVYNEITHGGDIAFSVEIIPENNFADPSYRFLLFKTNSDKLHIIAFKRGSKSTLLLDKKNMLINFDGLCKVDTNFYRDIVSSLAEVTIKPWLIANQGNYIALKWSSQIIDIHKQFDRHFF
ncbi:MAG: hypothetical protein Q8N30_03620 [Methylococcales bacterium]|nr:hypothetical protein [Methylococcales bacterium]